MKKALKSYKHLSPYLFRRWPGLLGIAAVTAASAMLAALQPWPTKLLVDYALGDSVLPADIQAHFKTLGIGIAPVAIIALAALARLGIFAIGSAIDALLNWAWATTGQGAVYDLSIGLFHRLQRLSLGFHSHRTVGDALSRISGDAYCLYTQIECLLASPAKYVLTIAAVGAVAWSMHPQLTLLTLAVAPIMAISALFFGPRLKHRATRNREIQSQLMAFVHQTLSAIPVVQAFGRETPNRQRFQTLADDAVDRSQRSSLVHNTYGAANGLIAALGTAAILYAAGMQVLSGALSLGGLLVFLAYLRTLQNAFQGLMSIYGRLKTAGARIDRVLEVLEAEDSVKDPAHPTLLPAQPKGHIRFENTSFGYMPGIPVLQDITLDISPGQTLAIVGPTGAGKTTLVSLIPRFFDPDKGRICFDGIDLRHLSLSDLRHHIGMVLQDPFLLPLTVAENIAYGRPGASRQQIVAAAEAACAHDFIQRLPQGYDTPVAERGAAFSGGQKQRIAIARALLKDAPILILDEPTASLDAATEHQVVEAIRRLCENRTAIVIAHRMSTVRHADAIAVLHQGAIAEQGTHDQLCASGGIYAGFYQHQFGPLIERVAG